LSIEDVHDLVKPKPETLDLVHEWLQASAVESLSYSPAKDWIEVVIPASEAERLLDTEYYVFEHEDGTRLVRTHEWSLPVHLHEHIDAIQPTTSFFRGAAQSNDIADIADWISPTYTTPSDPIIAKVCNVSSVTPECFMNLYSTKGYEVQAKEENCIAFNNFLGEIPIRPDTKQFLAKYRPEAVPGATEFPQISIAGGPVQDGPLTPSQANSSISLEANLDVQAILGISYPTPLISYSTGGSPPFIPDLSTPNNTNEPYLVWVNYVLGLKDVPHVISTSYGDDEQTVPRTYAKRVCQQFAQLGARGVSLLFASGDNGVGPNNTCISNDGKNTTKFLPSFPAGCPYVTTVGATHEFEPEVVAYRPSAVRANGSIRNAYASGAGFSEYFPRPKYQNRTVNNYVKKLNGLYDGLYNKCEFSKDCQFICGRC
jgi:tripeptidyl-peptidase-1